MYQSCTFKIKMGIVCLKGEQKKISKSWKLLNVSLRCESGKEDGWKHRTSMKFVKCFQHNNHFMYPFFSVFGNFLLLLSR